MNKEWNLGKPYNEPDGVIPIRLSFTAANPFPLVIARHDFSGRGDPID